MTLEDIRKKVQNEPVDIGYYIAYINHIRSKCPGGTSLSIPRLYQKNVETFCDRDEIPFLIIAEDMCATAATYRKLLIYEESR